jgi:hypothetical protein
MSWRVIFVRGEGGVPVPKRGVPVFLLAGRATQPRGYERIEKSARAKDTRAGLAWALRGLPWRKSRAASEEKNSSRCGLILGRSLLSVEKKKNHHRHLDSLEQSASCLNCYRDTTRQTRCFSPCIRMATAELTSLDRNT